MYNPFSIEGKVFLVTGAASGMGKATALTCAKMGAAVLIADYNYEGLQSTLNEMGDLKHSAYRIDLSDDSTWQPMLDNMPALDGIALCAGIANMNPFTFISREELDKVFSVNFSGPVLLVKSILQAKKLSKGASVVFVSSVDGPKVVHAGNSIYSASKSALVGVARNMAIDLAGKKIRVNCVLPGTTDTPLIRTSNVTEEQLAETAKQFPLKRFGSPQDMANAIIFLLSDGSSFITGTELIVDGGYSII